MMMSTDVFYEMPQNENLYQGQYDVKAGRCRRIIMSAWLSLLPEAESAILCYIHLASEILRSWMR